LLGLTISPNVFAPGTRSRSRLSALVPSSSEKKVMPVTLSPGWRRFVTRPIFTGSAPVLNTTGMVVVAFLAAKLDGGPPTAAMTLTLRRTKSAASSGRRSTLPSAQRYSIATFWPTT
jgi:hypothetical protein